MRNRWLKQHMIYAFLLSLLLANGLRSATVFAADLCPRLLAALESSDQIYWHPRPFEVDPTSSKRPHSLHILSAGQKGLGDPKQIDQMKTDMVEERFDYEDSGLSMAGYYHGNSHTITLTEGHHRVLASLELAYETGNWSYFNRLISKVRFDRVPDLPQNANPLPVRSRAIPFSKWSQFLKSLRPPRYNN